LKDSLNGILQKYQIQLIPEPTLNIIEFTELKLPRTSSTLIEYAAKKCFSEHEPTEDTMCLANRNLPSRTFVNIVSAIKVMKGRKSIYEAEVDDD
jgi:hypothetical protein